MFLHCSGLPIIGNDLGPVYDPDLEFFEFTMPGGKECPGRPVFTDNLLVMGICTCRFDKLEFALTLDQIRRWVHDCFDIEMVNIFVNLVSASHFPHIFLTFL